MKAVYFTGERQLEIREVPDPTPGPGEAIIEIKASGMCGSDLKVYRVKGGAAALGLPGAGGPVIAGHEPCGVVVEVGSAVEGSVARIDSRVMNHHYAGCGSCRHCNSGWTQMCDEGAVVFGMTGNGAHARYMKVPADSLVPLPEALSFKSGAAISCGTGTAFGALDRLALRGTETLAVFGQGPVGLSATMLAAEMGARVIALDVDAGRLQRASDYGADEVVDASAGNAVETLRDLTGGGVDCAMDCSGAPQARADAIQAARKWGRVAFVGEGADVTIDVSRDMNRKQLTVLGCWTFSKNGQRDCARFVADRGLDVDSLFTHEWPLADAEAAYELFDTQTTGKGVLIPS
jgi:L-iditol 2-dehydrogenase